MKKIAKIIGASIGTALLLLSMTPIVGSAEGTTSGDYTYEIQGGDVVITNYNGEDEDVVVPAELDGKKVTAIGKEAFQMNADLVSVEIPDGVKTIGDHAFAIDTSLETITLPATVTEIGEAAFQQCAALKTVNFAGDEAAWGSITIADNNDEIKGVTPSYNASLTEQPSSETTSSETASSETTSSETTSSEAAATETTSSETASSETTSSAAATTTSTANSTEAAAEEPVPQESSVNIAYVIGGILVAIAVLDIIYWSIKKPQAPAATTTTNDYNN